eukprot:5750542-Pleurochrysis_carterae.AAC.1
MVLVVLEEHGSSSYFDACEAPFDLPNTAWPSDIVPVNVLFLHLFPTSSTRTRSSCLTAAVELVHASGTTRRLRSCSGGGRGALS